MANIKEFTQAITERFLHARKQILLDRSNGKITAKDFSDTVGMSQSNIARIERNPGEFNVTLEAVGRICHFYKISPYWIIIGNGEMRNFSDVVKEQQNLKKRVIGLEKAVFDIEVKIELLSKIKK